MALNTQPEPNPPGSLGAPKPPGTPGGNPALRPPSSQPPQAGRPGAPRSDGKPPPTGEAKRTSYRTSVMANITVHVKLNPDFSATLVDISETGCRLRAAISLNIGTDLWFEWDRFNKPPLRLTGKVMSRNPTQVRALYDYGIAFGNVLQSTRDAIIAETMELQRREALRNAPAESSIAKQVASQLGTKRSAYRAKVSFEVFYTLPGRPGKRPAKANDLSLGGLRLIADEKLPEGTLVDFSFKLPERVLKVYENERKQVEVSPFGERTVVKKTVVRPFEEIRLRGRVVKVLKEYPKVEVGIAFVDPHPFMVSELSRFIHAVQLAQIRAERG